MWCIPRKKLLRKCLQIVKMFIEYRNSIKDDERPGRLTIAGRPEMVVSTNGLILADRIVTTEGISEKLDITWSSAHKITHDDLAFSKVRFRWVSLGQYGIKNNGNHQSVWLETAVTSSLYSISFTHYSHIAWLPRKFFCLEPSFQNWWSENDRRKMTKNSVPKFLFLFRRKQMFSEECSLYWKKKKEKENSNIFHEWNMNPYIVKVQLIYWMTQVHIQILWYFRNDFFKFEWMCCFVLSNFIYD